MVSGATIACSDKVERKRRASVKPFRIFPFLVLVSLLFGSPAAAQPFNAARYLDQCLKLEAGGDLTSARESCRNALELEPGSQEARLAAGRLELRLGSISAAEDLLMPLRSRGGGPEVNLLLAEAALERGDPATAGSFLAAAPQLDAGDSAGLRARHAWLSGRMHESEGRLQLALGDYRRATALEPAVPDFRRSASLVLMALGLPDAAADELLTWRSEAGMAGDAALRAELARALWAAGELQSAAAEFESALQVGRDGSADVRAANLRSLAAVRLGLGDWPGAVTAFSDAFRHGNLTWLIRGNRLFFLLVLFAVLAVQLFAEGRRPAGDQAPAGLAGERGPEPARVFRVLAVSLLLGGAAALLYGAFVTGNIAALFTPVQGDTVKAVYIVAFSTSAALLSLSELRRSGAPAGGPGQADQQVLAGLGLGLLLLLFAVAFLTWAPEAFKAPWQTSLTRLNPLSVAALLLLPFAEVFFRALALPVFHARYGDAPAIFVSAGLYALVLGTPVLLSLLLGSALGYAFLQRGRALGLTVAAQLVLQLGMLVAFILWPGLSLLAP